MFAAPPTPDGVLGETNAAELWRQARGELAAYARALDRGGIGITAAQIRMAMRMADLAPKLLAACELALPAIRRAAEELGGSGYFAEKADVLQSAISLAVGT